MIHGMKRAFLNARFFTSSEILSQGALLVGEGVIEGFVPVSEIPGGYEEFDLGGRNLAPALVDLQLYGGMGRLFSMYPSVESIGGIRDYCHASGTSWFQPTMATNSLTKMKAALDAVKAYRKSGLPGMIGLHLEGPYLNPVKRGAHLERFIHSPTLPEVRELLDYAEGHLSMMTLAPEQCPDEVIRLLMKEGVVVSAGHSNASYAEAMKGFSQNQIPAGTHLFNAMPPLQSRAPGLVGAVFDHPGVRCSVVADGIHVDFKAIRISKRIMGERLFLITDTVEENSNGEYIYIREKDRYVKDDGTLAGSLLTMMTAVRNCVEQVGIPLDEALRMASLYPLQLMGMDREYGRLRPGYQADLIVFGDDWQAGPLIRAGMMADEDTLGKV